MGIASRVQLTSDGHRTCLEEAFGVDMGFAQPVKTKGSMTTAPDRYSPAKCVGAKKVPFGGNPDNRRPVSRAASAIRRGALGCIGWTGGAPNPNRALGGWGPAAAVIWRSRWPRSDETRAKVQN